MSEPTKAVFLSYASQDAEAAKRICESLRAAGVEVWFDQSELVGGDAWDQKIRRQIKDCALFVPVISANTNARLEGYFRREWRLAVDRMHDMDDDVPFLLPVVIDDTPDAQARVPERFRERQWTRLPAGETPPAFTERLKKLLEGGAPVAAEAAVATKSVRTRGSSAHPGRRLWWIAAPIFGMTMALFLMMKESRKEPAPVPAAASVPSSVPPAAAPVSEARQLAAKARAMSLDKYDSSADDYAAAEGLIKRALELDGNDGEIWAVSSLFNTLIRTRGYDDAPARREAARRDAERALKLAPDSVEALYALARWQRDNDPSVAEQTFKEVLARAPNHEGALGSLGTLYARTGRFDEAIALFERLARVPDWRALALYSEYLAYFSRSRFADAERCVRESVATAPSANSVAGLAMVELTWHGDPDAAIRAFADVPMASRNEHRVVWISAFAQLAARQPDEALKTLERLSADFIQDNWFVGPKAYWVGRAHAQAGRTEAARLAFEDGLAVATARLKEIPSTALRVTHAELLAWLGRTDEALREARTIAELERPGAPIWIISRVRIMAVLGRADDALSLLASLVPPKPEVDYGWPLTPALLKLDPLWDKIRGDSRFQALTAEPQEGTALASTVPLSPARALANKALALQTSLEATREDFALAEDYCQRALKLDSTDGEIWAIYSELNSAYGYRGWDTSPERREQTRVMAERAIRLAPTSVEARLAQAGWWAAFGVNRDQREKLLREVVHDQPDNHEALRFLAVTVLGRPDGLEECLAINERSAALPGGDPLALYNNARYLLQRGRPAEAFATIQRALAQREFSSALVFKIAMDVRLHGDLATAAATLRRIPESILLEDRANYTAGLVRFLQRDADAALAAWGGFPRDYYADFQYEGPKGLLLGLADELDHRDAAAKIEWKTALALVDKRIATTPNNPAPYYYKAYLLACLDEKAAAGENLSTYEQLSGFKLAPGVPLSLEMAVVYARLGRRDEILAHLPVNGLPQMRIDPRFEALRADPRLERLAAQQAASDPKPKP